MSETSSFWRLQRYETHLTDKSSLNEAKYELISLSSDTSGYHSDEYERTYVSSGISRCAVWQKLADISEMRNASIIKAMTNDEVVSTSETYISFYQTTHRNTPEDSHLLDALTLTSVLTDNPVGKMSH
jgi:hypothetical protein